MKILLTTATTLLAATFFQAPTTAPMRMGLWEITTHYKTQQPDGTEKTSTRIFRNCTTETNWLKEMGPTAPNACPKTNEVWSKNGYSFDVACPGKPKVASVSVHFDSPETEHVVMHMLPSPETPMKLDAEGDAHWVSASCGDVSPDHPVLVR
jgi:hypothetical protein